MPAKTKKLRAKWQRIWRERRYMKGICSECMEQVFQDRTRCFKHLLAHAKSSKEWRKLHKSG